MTNSSIQVSVTDVLATLALIAVAVGVSFWRRADLEEDIGIAVVRSFIQLTAIGYVINFIFDQDSLWFVVALIAVNPRPMSAANRTPPDAHARNAAQVIRRRVASNAIADTPTPTHSRYIAKKIPDASLVELDRVGHFSMFENAERVIEVLDTTAEKVAADQ